MSEGRRSNNSPQNRKVRFGGGGGVKRCVKRDEKTTGKNASPPGRGT